ncbi:MAG: hypothetical protein SFZ23_08525, partial [Planctomycetota bacterium]|nr:hypothetical protein [Planctomycetota bacterium]
ILGSIQSLGIQGLSYAAIQEINAQSIGTASNPVSITADGDLWYLNATSGGVNGSIFVRNLERAGSPSGILCAGNFAASLAASQSIIKPITISGTLPAGSTIKAANSVSGAITISGAAGLGGQIIVNSGAGSGTWTGALSVGGSIDLLPLGGLAAQMRTSTPLGLSDFVNA